MSEKPHTVFVSHAHADNELCDHYVNALKKRGLDVWYDRTNMQVGHSLSEDIEAELRQRTAFVMMATPASLASQWVRSEIAAFRYLAAQDSSRLFVPVRAAACDMPLLWRDILWIDAVALGFDAAIDALAVALSAPAEPLADGDSVGASPERPSALGETAGDLVKRGDELGNQQKIAEALATYERALELDPNSVNGWIGKGWALGRQKRYDEAGVAYDRATTLDPNNVRAWVGKGWALGMLRRYAEALPALERAITLDPNNADAWADKSSVLAGLGHPLKSLAAYQRAHELDRKQKGS